MDPPEISKGENHGEGHSAAPRSKKACLHCKALKVRCMPSDPDDTSKPCQRCIKSRKECIVPSGVQKRTRKSDSRVLMLEDRLKEMTEMLAKERRSQMDANLAGSGPLTSAPPPPSSSALPGIQYAPFAKPGQDSSAGINGDQPAIMNGTGLAGVGSGNGATAGFVSHQPPQQKAGVLSPQWPLPPLPLVHQKIPSQTSSTASASPHPGFRFANSAANPPSQLSQQPVQSASPATSSFSPNFSSRLQPVKSHSSIHSTTPDDLNIEPPVLRGSATYRVGTGVDIAKMREEVVETWNEIADRARLREQQFDKVPFGRIPTYETDLISRGIISLEDARSRFEEYRRLIYQNYSMVSVEETTFEDCRQQTPLLFLTIISTTSMVSRNPDDALLNTILYTHAYESIIYETMILGVRTTEVLKCLILVIFWNNEPDICQFQKTQLLATMAISVANDLGITGSIFNAQQVTIKYDRIQRPQMLPNPTTIECRRLCMAVFCSQSNMWLLVRRPFHFFKVPYVVECCDIIESAPDANDGDRKIATFTRLCLILEEMSRNFYLRDVSTPADLTETQNQMLMRYFEGKLADFKKRYPNVPRDVDMFFNSLQMMLHEAALYVPLRNELGRSPYSDYSLAMGCFNPNNEVSLLRCLGVCLDAARNAALNFVSLPLEKSSTIPFFAFSRITYCISMLSKIEALKLTNPETAKLMDSASVVPLMLQVEQRLQTIAQEFPCLNTAANMTFNSKLLLVHFDCQLNNYFNSEFDDPPVKPHSRRDSDPTSQQQSLQPPPGPHFKDGSIPGTPLDVLTAVALEQQHPRGSLSNEGGLDSGNGNVEMSSLPEWLTSDTFWKDLVPNLEQFSGYDIY